MENLDPSALPPGFGFHPTDVELVAHYLRRKILGLKIESEVIPEVDIYKHEPWDLPAKSLIRSRECKWHFFNAPDRKYPNGCRSNRATKAGYWKSTGKDRMVRSRNRVIGTKKTLVFHEGRPPHGKRTEWIMHEYYLNDKEFKAADRLMDAFVLCRVTKRNCSAADDEETYIQEDNKNDISIPYYQNFPSLSTSQVVSDEMKILGSDSNSSKEVDYNDWVTELYDPSFGVIPSAPSECEIRSEVPSSCFVPKSEVVDLDVVSNSVNLHNSLLNDVNPLYNLQGTDHDLWYLGLEDADFAEMICDYKNGLFKSGDITEYPPFPQTVIASTERITYGVHKIELHNKSGALNHTVILDNGNHHLEFNEVPELDSSKKPKVPDLSKVKTERETLHKISEEKYLSENTHSDACYYEPHEFESRPVSSRNPFHWGARALARRMMRKAHRVLSRRCSSSSGLNCIFMGGCLTGAAAFTSYIIQENV